MDEKSKPSPIFIGIIVTTLILLGGAFWYWQSKRAFIESKPKTDSQTSAVKKSAELGAQIFEKTQNPTKDKFPESNPFTVDTNPFSVKTNPFKDAYKNPFK